MENIGWQKQTTDKPLFPDLLWSRPQNKQSAGKLLVVGGNLHSFSSVAEAFAGAEKAGAGTTRFLLPDKLQKNLAAVFPEADFASSTPVGSFSRQALDQLLESAAWADGVLLAGHFSKNSETAILLELFLEKYKGSATLTGDSLDYFLDSPAKLLTRENTVVLADFGHLQSFAKKTRPLHPITSSMSLYELVKALAGWSGEAQASIATHHAENIVLSHAGQVSTTLAKKISFPELAAYLAVWQLQNPSMPFEALNSAVFEYTNK